MAAQLPVESRKPYRLGTFPLGNFNLERGVARREVTRRGDNAMLLKRMLMTAALALPLAVAATPASADDFDVDFRVGIGTPHYHGYRAFPDGYFPYRRKMSCWQARELLRDRGFRRVRTLECNGRVYTFRVYRRGRPVVISVNARTGAMWRS
jgi:hypothetical protein